MRNVEDAGMTGNLLLWLGSGKTGVECDKFGQIYTCTCGQYRGIIVDSGILTMYSSDRSELGSNR